MCIVLWTAPFFHSSGQDTSTFIARGNQFAITPKILSEIPRPKVVPLKNVEKVQVKGNLIPAKRFESRSFDAPAPKKASEYANPVVTQLSHNPIDIDWPELTKVGNPMFRNYATKNISFLDTEQGLPSSYVWAVTKDTLGYIWLGTYGGGVSRYDGRNLLTFSVNEGLISDNITCLLVDSKGHLWIGSDKGLHRFDGQNFYLYTLKEGLSNDVIWSLLEDSSGKIWIGTEKGINIFDPESDELTIYTKENGLIRDNVWSIIEDHPGNFWIGSEMGVTMIDPAGLRGDDTSGEAFITQYKPWGNIDAEEVWSIAEGPDENIWLGTNAYGVIRIDRNENQIIYYDSQNDFPSDWIWSISHGLNGDLWFATYSDGIIRYLKDENGEDYFQHFNDDEGLNYDFATSSYIDEFGKVYIGTDGGGLSILDESKGFSRYFNENMGMRHRNVEDTYTDSEGNHWLASYNGLHKIAMHADQEDDLQVSIFGQESGLTSDEIWSILEDSQGNFWFGSQFGLNKLNPKSNLIEIYNTSSGLIADVVSNLFEDSRQNLWIGSEESGLTKINLNTNKISHYGEETGLAGSEIMTMVEDANGDLWIATFGNGLIKYVYDESGEQIVHYGKESGLPDVGINALFYDLDGILWVGTDGKGLYLIDPENRTPDSPVLHISSTKGLSSNYIWSIVSDSSRMWIGTENGINILHPDEAVSGKLQTWENPEINSISTQDGLKAADSYGQEISVDQQGNFWWITGKGLVIINPKKYNKSKIKPRMLMQNISIGNEFVDFRKASDSTYLADHPLNKFLRNNTFSVVDFQNYPKELIVPHYFNTLTFRFSTLEWYAPGEVTYEYQIPGFTEGWIPTDENVISFNNLDPGSYSFQVRALNLNGQQYDQLKYDFQVAFPWWRMWWAYVFYSILVILVVVSIVRWRTSQIEKSRTKLRLLVDRKTEELKKSKSELEKSLEQVMATRNQLIQSEKMASLGMLSSGIAHELRNPINAVSNGSKILEQDFQDLLSLIESYEQALESGSNTIAATREKVEYSQLIEDLKDHLKIIELGAKQTIDIVNSLNNYSRLDKEDRVEGDIHQALENTLILLESRLKFNVEVKKDFDFSINNFPCYYGQLNQLFMNLLSNAIEAIESKNENGLIIIKTSQSGEYVQVDITDNGIGIDTDNKKKIFEPFYTSKDIGAGTGLGLWISQTIAQKHQGELTFESQPGKGSTFSVTLKMN